MKFCEKLQMIRKSNNLSQEQLADKLNISRQAVSKWESGQGYPEIDKLIHISKIFEISLDELLKKETIDNGNIELVASIVTDLKEPDPFKKTTFTLGIFAKKHKTAMLIIVPIITIFMIAFLMFVLGYSMITHN